MLKDPKEMELMAQKIASISSSYPATIDGSSFGTPYGTLTTASGQFNDEDQVSVILEDVIDTASGVLGGVGGLITGKTMDIAGKLASGVVDTSGELAESILGDTSEVLAGKMFDEYGGGPAKMQSRAGASVSISVTVSAPEVCTACSQAA